MLLLVEGSTGGERKEFLGGEGQKEFAPEEMEHIQVCESRDNGLSAFGNGDPFPPDRRWKGFTENGDQEGIGSR